MDGGRGDVRGGGAPVSVWLYFLHTFFRDTELKLMALGNNRFFWAYFISIPTELPAQRNAIIFKPLPNKWDRGQERLWLRRSLGVGNVTPNGFAIHFCS